jgi:hypothetical protein
MPDTERVGLCTANVAASVEVAGRDGVLATGIEVDVEMSVGGTAVKTRVSVGSIGCSVQATRNPRNMIHKYRCRLDFFMEDLRPN